MIEKTNDINIINEFLKNFNVVVDNNPYEEILIYKKRHKPIGLISYSIIYEKVEINYLYVLDEYRRKGIATKLIKKLVKIAKRKENITLEVNENNSSAIALYKKMGFNEIAIRPNYYGNENAILMFKNLGD